MKLILVRHGETITNERRIIEDQGHGELTAKGIEQAKKLAKRLAKEHIDVVYCSDLARAKDTAREIIKFHPLVPVYYVKDIRERHVGRLQGSPYDEWFKVRHDNEQLRSVGAELPQDVFNRAKRFLDRIYKKYNNDVVLVVAHGLFNRSLICVITNRPASDVNEMENPRNTSVSIFDITKDGKHRIHLINCIKHLK